MIDVPTFSASDNETRVRESLVAPLLRALGYSDDEILPEFPLAFRVQGDARLIRADYVVSTEHQFGLPPNKIVIEVKKPSVSIFDDDVLDQARIYASHRDIQATYVVLVNGIHLSIYAPSGPRLDLLHSFEVSKLKESWETLFKILGAPSLRWHFAGVQIIEEIGSGGYGRVFKANYMRLNRLEALKVLHPGSQQADTIRRRFERGARGLAVFEHPYICQVYDLNVYRGCPYYRMELVPGVGITQYVTEQNLTLNERLALFQKICEALSHAHENEVVHCDLKPANVLVKADGIPKIIDFDFCHIGSGASTVLSQIVATIAYMDPTIWKNPQNRDVLADVYSTGLLLWSILTGKDLTPSWTPHFLLDELSRVSKEAESFGPIILRCIQEDRFDRPQSIENIIKLLGVSDWHRTTQSMLDGAVANFSMNSPNIEFEYRFRLWQQTQSLPGSTDFDRITKGIPKRSLSRGEQEFIFRSACAHWRKQYRHLFRDWSAEDLINAAQTVLDDRSLDEAHRGTIAETHPARKAVDILAATDEYRDKRGSELVARSLLDQLLQERRRALFYTTLDDLGRFQCLKIKNSSLRKETSRVLMELIDKRLSTVDGSSAKQVGKILDKLDPQKCGEDSEEVARFIQKVAEQPVLRAKALKLLGCLENPTATDVFIEVLESVRGSSEFEKVALIAIGVNGRHKRRAIAEYLSKLPDYTPSEELRQAIDYLLQK